MPAQGCKVQVETVRDKREEGAYPEQGEWRAACPSSKLIETRARQCFGRLLTFAKTGARDQTLHDFEQSLVPLVFTLGRLLVALFLCHRHEELKTSPSETHGGRVYRRRKPRRRELGTFFGKVLFWRTYMYAGAGAGEGYCPLDRRLKLPGEGFSLKVTSLMARLATKLSYAQAVLLLRLFLGWSPSQTTVERAVLGLGQRTAAWFEKAPAPDGDGEVLVVMIDSKATPTATEGELEKRRGKRDPMRIQGSPRHRGRAKRKKRGRKKRRKKGDKSKNGRATTVLVMYTLKSDVDERGSPILKGPINRRLYASYAPKRHCFAIARREANKRGFTPESGKTIQIVTDGEENFARYTQEYFPEAIHTLDIYHALEYLWDAGRSLHKEGSDELESWVKKQKGRLYKGYISSLLVELNDELAKLPKTGPGNKGKRERLGRAVGYLSKRVHMMDYATLLAEDLEIASGSVEGAVRYLVAQRFDCAGMRWIRERAEALLQLRCIEVNGQWEDFIAFIQANESGSGQSPGRAAQFHSPKPGPLPVFGVAA